MSDPVRSLTRLIGVRAGPSESEKAPIHQVTFVAPGSPTGGEGCAALLGGAMALSAFYMAKDATSADARLRLLIDPAFPSMIAAFVREASLSAFDAAFLDLSPFWIAAGMIILEHPVISDAAPRPSAICGVALSEAVPAAIHLSSLSPPFDRVVPQLVRLATEDP